MEKVLYPILLFCLFSCSSGKQSEKLTLEKALETASVTSNAKDSLFLGFNFGMDSCLVERKVDSLIQVGKLFHQDGYLRYKFNIAPFFYLPAVGFVYTNDTLSKVSLAFLNEENLTIELIKNSIAANVVKILSRKGYDSFQEQNAFNSDDYYFIKNNTVISIKAYERFVLMSYSNAIIDKQEAEKKQKENQLKSEQTLSDI